MAAADQGGSFWATFGGAAAGAQEATPLETLLQTPSCSVEALLDEEDVIQEFKSANEALVSRLCANDACKALMEFITCEPPPNATEARCFRYPFVAVELITCGPARFYEALVNCEQTEAMDLFWSFMGSTPPAQVNPVLAGYFSRTAVKLLSRYPNEVVCYLRSRGPEKLLEEFLDRLHQRSLAELLERLLCVEREDQVVFQTQDLVAQLLTRWQACEEGSDAQENISLLIAGLLSQKDVLCWIEDLMRQLTAPPTVRFLIEHIFSQQPCGVTSAASLLTTVIVHSSAGLKDLSVLSTPTLSPLAPPFSSLGEEDVVNIGADEERIVGEAAVTRPTPSSPPCSPARGGNSEEWLERRRYALMKEVASHFPRLRELLESSLSQSLSDMALVMPQGTICAVGGTTYEVVSLVSTLLRTGLEVILEAVLNNNLLPSCVEVFFRHPWSSMLHNSVRMMLSEVFSSAEGSRIDLARQLLKEARFAERLVNEYSAEAEVKASTLRQRHARVGYMGHLFHVACELRDLGSKLPEVSEMLMSTSGWAEVVLPALEALHSIHNEELGGGVPSSDRGLASAGIQETSQQNNFDDDDDDEQMFARHEGGEHRKADDLDDFVLQDPQGFEANHARGRDSDEENDDWGPERSRNSFGDDAFDPDSPGSGTSSFENSSSAGWANFSEQPAPATEQFAFAAFDDAQVPAPGVAFATDWSSLPSPDADASQVEPVRQQPLPPASWVASFDTAQVQEASRPKSPVVEDAARSPDVQDRAASQPSLAAGGSCCSTRLGGLSEAPAVAPVAAPAAPSAAPVATPAAPSAAPVAAPAVPSAAPAAPVAAPAAFASVPASLGPSTSAATAQPQQASTPASESFSTSLGAENLFALIGEGLAPSAPSKPPAEKPAAATPAASSTVPKQPSIASGTQWPLPPAAAAAPPPPPWCTSMPSTNGGAFGQPFSQPSLSPAMGAGNAPAEVQFSDRSWVADFDPLAGGGGGAGPPGARPASVAPAQGQQAATGSDLAFLNDFAQWQGPSR
eukprot:TRINITY_DN36950_c0_g1_i1.p1 TRINITY_DN36950_c0_g1~~TRINITY_DN36950_c0_g1_i1.p1  ORF type:complete len:1023 (+),score=217.79 TRINITY_DN36950_c0_g1_i1:83-3151(+)